MLDKYISLIARNLGVKDWQIANCVMLLGDGDTIPFISRYRKEQTGGLDDAQVAEVKHLSDVYSELEKRKETVLAGIEAAGALDDEMRKKISDCISPTELEDLYLPYRPKRRTRASIAAEKGLAPLADAMWNGTASDPEQIAYKYLNDKVESVEDALQGARDIIAERLSETAEIRRSLRSIYRKSQLRSKLRKGAEGQEEAIKFRNYYDFSFNLSRIPSHNLLAVLRGESLGILSIDIDAPQENCEDRIFRSLCEIGGIHPGGKLSSQLRLACQDALKRLIDPSISSEVIKEAKAKADEESTRVFGDNLKQLLLEAPLGQKRTLAFDPGFRNGCKIAVIDSNGALLEHCIIYPHPPQNRKIEALQTVQNLIDKYDIEAIALGNGTASRESSEFLRKVSLPEGCSVHLVSEDGASIYSASEVARKEFPDEDVTVRGAVSIGRRLMDPLAELVKIDPKNLGVGQYQHDVDQTLLKEKLDQTVEYCVNLVGVNLGTASAYLLSYVSGIGPVLAENIVAYRQENGAFKSRKELLKVPRLGAKTYEQCAGFLRITDADNPLDNSAVHPESYHIADKIASDLGVSVKELIGNESLCDKITAENYVSDKAGLPTVKDIIKELRKPGLDPRQALDEFKFADGIQSIEDLREGMELPGIVTNITAFGAFVDIGVHENGLIHRSQMGLRGGAEPSSVLKLHKHITVKVIGVDLERSRISLRLLK